MGGPERFLMWPRWRVYQRNWEQGTTIVLERAPLPGKNGEPRRVRSAQLISNADMIESKLGWRWLKARAIRHARDDIRYALHPEGITL